MKTLTPVLAASLSVAASYSASAAVLTFTGPTGGLFNNAANYSPSQVPTSADTVLTNQNTSATAINFAANGSARNLAINSGGPSSLTLDLNGNTLNLANQSDFRNGTTTFIDGVVRGTNIFKVFAGATVEIGSGVNVGLTGGANQAEVDNGGTLRIDGGRFQNNTGERDLRLASGSLLDITGATGGSLRARYANFSDGSTVDFTLTEDTAATNDFYDSAKVSFSAIETANGSSLGDLTFDLASGFVGEVGDDFDLITLTFNPGGTRTDFSTQKFDNLAQGAQVEKGIYTFEANYTSGLLSLSIVDVEEPVIPEPASLALLGVGSLFMLGRSRRA